MCVYVNPLEDEQLSSVSGGIAGNTESSIASSEQGAQPAIGAC